MSQTVLLHSDAKSQQALAEIDDSIAYVQSLLKKYKWERSESAKITKDLDFIVRKRNDKNLYLSVIGEFSSGKSTFINALLREELLGSKNLGGTTIANTIIRYAPQYDLLVNFKDGTTEVYSQRLIDEGKAAQPNWFIRLFKGFLNLFRPKGKKKPVGQPRPSISLETLRERIGELTTNEQYARRVKEVILEHPSEYLKSGIVIIDTPGTNFEAWHEEVTKTALRDVSDLSVILTAANKPVEDSLKTFIKSNQDLLEHCIFLATKMDDLRAREREGQLDWIRQTLSGEPLFIKEPVVLPHTPMFVLGEADREYRKTFEYEKSDYGALLEESYKTETKIFQLLAQNRIIIQVKKMSGLMTHVFSFLETNMVKRQEDHRKHYAALEKHQKPDFVEFINSMAEKYLNKFNAQYEKHKERQQGAWDSLSDSQSQNLADIFFSIPKKKQLEPFCKNQIPNILSNQATELVQQSHQLFNELTRAASKLLQEFWVDFSKIYSELAALDVKSANLQFSIDHRQIGTVSFDHNALNASFSDFSFFDNVAKFGGAGAGAIVGTILFPGVGTIIGGALGGLLGSLFGPDIDKLKKEIWNKIAPNIGQYYQNVYEYIADDIHKKYENLFDHIHAQLDECFRVYGELVARMRKQNEDDRALLEQYISMAGNEVKEIKNKKQILDGMRA